MNYFDRRFFVKSLAATAAFSLAPACISAAKNPQDLFDISLAEWSLHHMLRANKLTNMQFPEFTKKTFGINAVEYVNTFFLDKAKDKKYLGELKQRCDDNGVKSLLIMCGREGNIGDPNKKKLNKSVENHYKWVEAAKFLGCHSIRVNANSRGSRQEQLELVSKGLTTLSTFAQDHGINVIVENHGGLSSDGAWLAQVMKNVDMPNCGTLPDFGNFKQYDRYKGVRENMPFAKGVSAKSDNFNDQGEETRTNFLKMMKIVLDAGYRGHVGVEFNGRKGSEIEGVKKTRDLLVKVRTQLAPHY